MASFGVAAMHLDVDTTTIIMEVAGLLKTAGAMHSNNGSCCNNYLDHFDSFCGLQFPLHPIEG